MNRGMTAKKISVKCHLFSQINTGRIGERHLVLVEGVREGVFSPTLHQQCRIALQCLFVCLFLNRRCCFCFSSQDSKRSPDYVQGRADCGTKVIFAKALRPDGTPTVVPQPGEYWEVKVRLHGINQLIRRSHISFIRELQWLESCRLKKTPMVFFSLDFRLKTFPLKSSTLTPPNGAVSANLREKTVMFGIHVVFLMRKSVVGRKVFFHWWCCCDTAWKQNRVKRCGRCTFSYAKQNFFISRTKASYVRSKSTHVSWLNDVKLRFRRQKTGSKQKIRSAIH